VFFSFVKILGRSALHGSLRPEGRMRREPRACVETILQKALQRNSLYLFEVSSPTLDTCNSLRLLPDALWDLVFMEEGAEEGVVAALARRRSALTPP